MHLCPSRWADLLSSVCGPRVTSAGIGDDGGRSKKKGITLACDARAVTFFAIVVSKSHRTQQQFSLDGAFFVDCG